MELASRGWEDAFARDRHFANGLNVHRGSIRHPEVAKALEHAVPPMAA
jgi:alanine dehydrogenase